jgi:DNA repair protein RecN (Recombination protein N)
LEDARRGRPAAFERDLRTRLARLGFGAASIWVEVDDRDSVRASLTDGALVDPAPIPGLHFAFQPNPGEPARPLQRIASGGELSRVMLSVKSMMAERDRVAVLVFDEVDQGIGGGVAEEVGALLFNLSKGRQVLCITHLPMIAAFPSRHFVVGKSTSDGRTSTSVQAIEGDARVEELARLLAGARATETTRAQAAELLAAAASTPRDPGARRAEAPKRRAVSSKKPRAKGAA